MFLVFLSIYRKILPEKTVSLSIFLNTMILNVVSHYKKSATCYAQGELFSPPRFSRVLLSLEFELDQ